MEGKDLTGIELLRYDELNHIMDDMHEGKVNFGDDGYWIQDK